MPCFIESLWIIVLSGLNVRNIHLILFFLGNGRVYCGQGLDSLNFWNIDPNIGQVHGHHSCNETAEWTNKFYNSEKR